MKLEFKKGGGGYADVGADAVVVMVMLLKLLKGTYYTLYSIHTVYTRIQSILLSFQKLTRLDWVGRRLKVFLCGEHCEAQWPVENGGERGESCEVLNH